MEKATRHADAETIGPEEPLGALAVELLDRFRNHPGTLVYVASTSERAEDLAAILAGLDPQWRIAHLPAWDSLPFDRIAPSHRVMGLRAGVFRWLLDAVNHPDLVVTSPRAALQRTPPLAVWRDAHLEFRAGDDITEDELAAALIRLGYEPEDEAEEPGTFALAGQVIDVFPAAAPRPCRIEVEDRRIKEIRSFDPASKRSLVEAEVLVIDPASEVLGEDRQTGARWRADRLLTHYGELATLFDYWPDMSLLLEERAQARIDEVLQQLQESYEDETSLAETAGTGLRPASPERLFLTRDEWLDIVESRLIGYAACTGADASRFTLPRLLRSRGRAGAYARFVSARRRAGVVALATSERRLVSSLMRLAGEPLRTCVTATSWQELASAKAGTLASFALPLRAGFQHGRVAVVAPADVLGLAAASAEREDSPDLRGSELATGQPAVHFDHGLGVVEGLETVEDPAAAIPECVLRMQFAESRLLVPVRELWKVWPYDAEAGSISLDRLRGSSWADRRSRLEEDIARAATELVRMSRESARAPKLAPDWGRYDRFAARFPHVLTPDQASAIRDVTEDLTSGRPMDRLVCGDVGFGKTEVALHAIALAVFSGKQAAMIAPTTVLARQHLATIQRRFRGMGLRVEQLSRLLAPAEARAAKERIARGEADIVVGTHAILSRTVRFKDLALVVVDEEQRFGAAQKKAVRDMARKLHRLTLTATPIPRTLQMALVGLRSLSTLRTPPRARSPVRTLAIDFTEQAIRHALLREKERSGQSFFVCPRIQDLRPMHARLRAICAELDISVIHGRMPAAEVDEALMRFSGGAGDVLLATNIIESGLDIPNANTILVWHPDRFGLAQLHQLRGRVGRGSRRGVLYLVTEPGEARSESTSRRLEALQELSHLGAGFDISARDLAQRGAGDLLGEEQSGHVKLIGSALYEHLLRRAVASAQGETLAEEWRPEINGSVTALIPDSYVPEPEVRLSLYRRLARLQEVDDLEEMRLELEDRFGPLPEAVEHLLLATRLALLCRGFGILKLDVGPAALALTTAEDPAPELQSRVAPFDAKVNGGRIIVPIGTSNEAERLALMAQLADALQIDPQESGTPEEPGES